MALTDKLKSVGDAIRIKTGRNEEMTLDQMVTEISSIQVDRGGITIGENIAGSNILNLFYALENGYAATGEFILATPLPAGECLVLDSGLENLNGLFIANASISEKQSYDSTLWALCFFSDSSAAFTSKCVTTTDSILNGVPSNRLKEWRVDGGALYVTPLYGGNATYTPYYPGHKYVWVAW